jgi:membrane protease YdiL (CAAX protease family)
VRDVLRFADGGVTPLLVLTTGANAIAEELFFRGALFSAMCESRPVIASTIAYAAATSATRNPALVLAGATLGALLGLQRRASGGVAAPAVTHLTWSLLTLWFLPRLTCKPAPRRAAEADEATAAAERENCRTAREAPPGQ